MMGPGYADSLLKSLRDGVLAIAFASAAIGGAVVGGAMYFSDNDETTITVEKTGKTPSSNKILPPKK